MRLGVERAPDGLSHTFDFLPAMSFVQSLRFGWGRRLPIMQQAQTAECGLACVGMIANYFGHAIDLLHLRRRFAPSLKGATLNDVMQVASQLDLVARALRCDTEDLEQLRTPCILHWDMNHFVVLKAARGGKITIHDPAHGVLSMPLAQASKHFTGIALELMPSPQFKRLEARETISMTKLIGSVVGIRSAFAQVLLLSVALEVFGILAPLHMQWVMDQVLVSADVDLLTLLGIGFLMVLLFKNVISALRSWVVTWISSHLGVQWSINICAHLLKLPISYFEQRHVGDVLSRFGSLGAIQDTLTTRFVSAVLDGTMALITLVVLFVYSTALTWLVLGLFAAYALVRWLAYRPLRQATEDQLVHAARAQSNLLESIRGVQAIKLGNKQEVRVASYANAVVESTNKNIAIERLAIIFSTLQGTISGVGQVVLIWLAAKQVLAGEFTAGMLTAFVSFASQFTTRATGLIDSVIEFKMLRLHGERLADIVLTEVEVDVDTKTATELSLKTSQDALPGKMSRSAEDSSLTGAAGASFLQRGTAYGLRPEPCSPPAIEVVGLHFRYADTDPWVIDDCSFAIASGESVALAGASGQGKTTLAKLIVGLLRPNAGCVKVSGTDIRRVGLRRYRNMVSCVMQDDILFAGSIAENISFFDPEANQLRIEDAARLAQIHRDIIAMPMSYQSLVGDMGSSLSGGQVQRVLLARALYRQPSILVLDEATSHLDVEHEHLVSETIRKMGITRIIIAHRPETIRSADRAILIQSGKAMPVLHGQA